MDSCGGILLIVCIRSDPIFGRPPTLEGQTLPISSPLTTHSFDLIFSVVTSQKLSPSSVCLRWMIIANRSWPFQFGRADRFRTAMQFPQLIGIDADLSEKLALDLAQTRRIC